MDAPEARTLDARLMLGMVWSAVSFGGGQMLGFVSMLVVARLLEPSDFGIVALATTFLGFLQYAQESGMWAAVIYRREEDLPRAAGTAFVFTVAVAVAVYLATAAVAPLVADLFHQPGLTDVLRVLALLLVPRSLGIVPTALLERRLDYRSVALAEVSGTLSQTVLCVSLAVAGAGLWSLVGGYLAGAAVQGALAWLFTPLKPDPRLASWRLLREMMRYGRFVGIANVLNLGNRSVDNITVGRALGAAPLAYYALAYRLAAMPVQVIGIVVGRGVFAAFASLQGDLTRMREVYVQNLQRLAMLSLPASVGLALAARPLIVVLFGDRWAPAAGALQILAVFGVVRCFSSTTGEVWLALGRPQLRMHWEIGHAILVVPAVVGMTVAFGLRGAAAGMLLVDVLTGVPAIVITMRLLHLDLRALARALAAPVACAALLAVTLALLGPVGDGLAPPAALALLVAAGGAAFLAGCLLVARDLVGSMWLSLRSAPPAGS